MARRATVEDRDVFKARWEECTSEIHDKYGGEIHPRSVDFFMAVFDLFVRSPDEGVALVAEKDKQIVGVLLWGRPLDNPPPTRFGKLAIGYGTYVAPLYRREGIANSLRALAQRILYSLGFRTLMGATHILNVPALESLQRRFTPHQVIYTLDLNEPYKEDSSSSSH